MPARNGKQWANVPGKLGSGEYVDSRIYSDHAIFEEEISKIFRKVWMPVCHESELPDPFCFRTTTVAREPIMVVRGGDNVVRAFLNVCPHRGNMIENRPSGSFEEGSPSGAPKHMTCMFHAWQFDMKVTAFIYPVLQRVTRTDWHAVTWVCVGYAARLSTEVLSG